MASNSQLDTQPPPLTQQEIDKLNNSRGDLLFQQARIAFDNKKDDLAKTLCERLLSFEPDHPAANNLLGMIMLKDEEYDKAIKYFRTAIQIKPEQALYHANLAHALLQVHAYKFALAASQKAVQLNPKFIPAYLTMGQAFDKLGETVKAEAAFKKALVLHPENDMAYCFLGQQKMFSGQFYAAGRFYRKALTINADNIMAYNALSSIEERANSAEKIEKLENVYSSSVTSNNEKIQAAFSLVKLHESNGNYEQAFYYMQGGNQLRRRSLSFNYQQEKSKFGRLIQFFNAELFKKYEHAGCPDKTPIFVLGMPRSGTTLTEQILGSHSNVFPAGELHEFNSLIRQNFLTLTDGFEINVANLSPERIFSVGAEYIEKIRQYSKSAGYITDKMPGNYLIIGFIKLLLPNAKIIYCKREPVDICLSIYKHNFSEGHSYAADLHELGQYFMLFQQLMTHWRQVLPGEILEVQYESLVDNQEQEIKRILAFCELEWQDACLTFYNTERPVNTMSMTQVRKPIYKDAVNHWKKYEKHLKPLLDVLRVE